MLLKRYTIPIVLGACLGMIMIGVQISATALNAALGNNRTAAVMVLDKVDEGGLTGRILGKNITVRIPRAGDLSLCAGAAAGAAREISDQTGKYWSYCRERLYSIGGEAINSLARFYRTAAGAVLDGLHGQGLPGAEKQPDI